MASKAQEKISWPVVIVCIIVAFIFFGDFVLNYFGFKGVNEVVKVVVDDIKGGSDPKIVEPKPKSKTVEVIPSTSNSSENKKTLNEQETKDLSPTFDIVRVDPEGSGLIAGVAAPGSTISLLIDGTPDISTLVPADGQFVLMFDLPQSDEPTSLSLKEKKADGTIIISSATVLINPLSKGKVPIELDPPSVVGEALAVVDSEDAVVTITKQEVVASSAGNIGNNTIKKKPTIVIVDSTGTKVVQSTPVPISPKGDNVENVVIDTITYDDKGDVAISGRGSAGDFVRIYIDDKPVLLTSIGVDGSWVTPLTDIKQGLYKLRADEVSKSGTVLSRVETPFQRENVMIAAKGASAITVQPGYTLWAIAREKYGSGFQYVRVYQANQDLIKNPDLIYPGQVFKLPEE
ncbi:MAG: LysM peptidoglycan-binding domain-containing protein [Rhodobacterales bacterium]